MLFFLKLNKFVILINTLKKHFRHPQHSQSTYTKKYFPPYKYCTEKKILTSRNIPCRQTVTHFVVKKTS